LGSTVSRRFINLACHSSATSFNLNAMVLEWPSIVLKSWSSSESPSSGKSNALHLR
jgi:hypothetical protein